MVNKLKKVTLAENFNIEFIRKKNYRFLKEIGQGGTGRTVLIKDDIIDETFICKKYSPSFEDDKDSYFNYFVGEIKLLHLVYHKNIVRVFNYFLYPEYKTGYILMEYINGQIISDYLTENPDKLEDVFLQAIEGFRYLEENNILHRDIRPENILISNNGTVKIIDFGFGKSIAFENPSKSISLNWPYSTPNEFKENIYNSTTEVYFVGKLFEEIIKQIENLNFKFEKIITKMISKDYAKRISSFFEVYRAAISVTSNTNNFSIDEKEKYKRFADNIIPLLSKIPYESNYNKNIDEIIKRLEELYRNSQLEDILQNNSKLTSIFVAGKYSYFPKIPFQVDNLLVSRHIYYDA